MNESGPNCKHLLGDFKTTSERLRENRIASVMDRASQAAHTAALALLILCGGTLLAHVGLKAALNTSHHHGTYVEQP